ncbi:hypothetical protein BDQ12DRAFT_388968 [Crucibulum laeve]|uniref:Uncharacterized protein n=1 Tax=Crucibulum laeve TaxID=68775 RepID=A0A5C3MK87_9AGAR|nr:hypothetical protein BDQ12DRAFT_388968 [Crucibulum laeve]
MRNLRLLFIPLILQTLPSSAFSWSRAAPTAVAADVRDIAISANEVNALLLGHDALEKYSNRPDCFRRAAKSIRTRCAELEMDETERVNAAIAMTLCEVATAKHHSFPLECIPFSSENAPKNTDAQAQGTCVDALARSAQFWSSYSGYLREVPQLCFAFRRWNDIDSAKEIYRNATLEKIGLIKMMSDREKAALANIQEWRTQINVTHAASIYTFLCS